MREAMHSVCHERGDRVCRGFVLFRQAAQKQRDGPKRVQDRGKSFVKRWSRMTRALARWRPRQRADQENARMTTQQHLLLEVLFSEHDDDAWRES
jgi:hypothetical protein